MCHTLTIQQYSLLHIIGWSVQGWTTLQSITSAERLSLAMNQMECWGRPLWAPAEAAYPYSVLGTSLHNHLLTLMGVYQLRHACISQ
jgi:hypothetical protein